ncbi:UBA/TS-N domain protein [Dictyocaulus viviparus]|uniref:UBA/TS-N domain protein n=1 Tax=Dictyocaulus viviparus TaxID=29172 RepID=A0A0D8XFE0_DICVI|nr:UBA/TS-N domain protein [Dictyocaulus viviparus]
MSYSNTFQDYLRDIPMEIGKKFYPPPTINLPFLSLPEPMKNVLYLFATEKKARFQYDNANTNQEANRGQESHVNGITSIDSPIPSATSIVNELLLPCAAPSHIAPDPSQAHTVKPVCFEEFEGRGSVFDEIEWRAIDDKLALSQILGNTCARSAPKPPGTAVSSNADEDGLSSLKLLTNDNKSFSSIPSYPVLEFGTPSKSRDPLLPSSSFNKLDSASFIKPSNQELNIAVPSTSANESPLRVRLLTKGYRENLVNVALEKLPRDRLPHVEYYIKGMSILEKRKVDATKTILFLVESNLTDKQAVVQRAQTAEQLVGMGFSPGKVFPALLACEGNRVKALDTLLGSR